MWFLDTFMAMVGLLEQQKTFIAAIVHDNSVFYRDSDHCFT